MSVLNEIVACKRREVERRKRETPLEALLREPMDAVRDFSGALRAEGVSVIAEIKRRSPSKGALQEALDPAELAACYEGAGARAISVLTESDHFSGCDEDLRLARARVGLPVLRKDFTIDSYQIHEARRIGADAILLIVRILDDAQLRDYAALAHEIGLAVLVEVHDERELERALHCGARIVGINNRNLDTFEVNIDTSVRLREMMPSEMIAVAESGLHTRDDVRRVEDAGFDAILVGESLIRSADPGAKLAELLEGGA